VDDADDLDKTFEAAYSPVFDLNKTVEYDDQDDAARFLPQKSTTACMTILHRFPEICADQFKARQQNIREMAHLDALQEEQLRNSRRPRPRRVLPQPKDLSVGKQSQG
jgi:hypothetical protein